jgi:hypothetical protein
MIHFQVLENMFILTSFFISWNENEFGFSKIKYKVFILD